MHGSYREQEGSERHGREMHDREMHGREMHGSEPTILHQVGQRVQKIVFPERSAGSRRRSYRENFETADNSYLFAGLLLLVLLSFALSPGVLLTLPPGRGGIWMSGNTSTAAALVHALLLVFILYLI